MHLGVTQGQLRSLIRRGELRSLALNVYRATAGYRRSPHQAKWISLLQLDPLARIRAAPNGQPNAIVALESAAELWNLTPIEDDGITFIVPSTRPRRPGLRQVARRLEHGDWTLVQGLPVTTLATTISDLLQQYDRAPGGRGYDMVHLATAVATARDSLADEQLIHAVAPHAHLFDAPAGDGRTAVERAELMAGKKYVGRDDRSTAHPDTPGLERCAHGGA